MNIRLEIQSNDIAHVVFDRESSTANIFDRETMGELEAHIDSIEKNPILKGVIFRSTKDTIFIAGADINGFIGSDLDSKGLEEMVAEGQMVFERIAKLNIPTVAAIHGACLGGGLEMCLACDYRIASPDKSTKIGLPETSLGIVPGWGGCARLPRLVGLPNALTMILQGKRLVAKQAKKFGLVKEVVPPEHFERWALKLIHNGKPQKKSFWKTNNKLSAKFIASRVRPQLQKKTRGHYPAMFKALDITIQGLSLSIPETLTLERKALVDLIQTTTSNNLVRVFFMQERAKHLKMKDVSIVKGWSESSSPIPSSEHIAVIGAGTMGAGIAQWCSARGKRVLLKDISLDAIAKGMAAIGKVYHSATKRRTFTKTESRAGMDRIHPSHTDISLARTDIVIEAATENIELKRKIFKDLEASAGDQTILATNTSALSITELAESTDHPERVIGIHFFNPVHRMQLVEIVVGEKTCPDVTARTLQFVQNIGKMPVVTRDSPGFAVNRILMPYLTEAGHLFAGGASIIDIDEAMLDFGMPMGPLRLLDEVGIDVADHVASFFGKAFGDRMPAPESLGAMVTEGLLGCKSGKGFYVYEKGSRKDPRPNPDFIRFIRNNSCAHLTRKELQDRMTMVMLNEAARCMEENVVSSPKDIDFAMIMGTGFAPFRGGPLRYSDTLGISNVVDALDRLAAQESDRFTPCAVLRSMVIQDECWYPADRKHT